MITPWQERDSRDGQPLNTPSEVTDDRFAKVMAGIVCHGIYVGKSLRSSELAGFSALFPTAG